ncbi:hypothetical protein Pyrde_0922 [Pyrodictium delaneyi]|nr:hypothetical protein [Pyrodictium delaneyi]ALL00970.1 hypothetical protein Pyrde_0922 [Pyrodictium delaneyi]
MDNSEKLAKLLEKALRPIVDVLGISIEDIESLEIDPYGPRIVLEAKPSKHGARSLFLDASPDGVETVVTLEAPRGLDKNELEGTLAELIEESPETQSVEEYDVSYDPEEGEVTITLHARLLAELPSIKEVHKLLEETLQQLRGEP